MFRWIESISYFWFVLCVYIALVDFSEEEPLYQYVPDNDADHPPLNGDALFSQSLLLLSDGLASGALLSQYEQLYRKNANLAITEARKPEHHNKNRYRDISPCKFGERERCYTLIYHKHQKTLFVRFGLFMAERR